MEKEKKSILTKWWFWVLAVIGLFIIIGIFTPSSKDKDSKTKTTEQAKVYSVGENVTVKDLRWKVVSAEDKGSTLKGSESKYPDFEKDKKANGNGKFIKLTMEVENLGKDMKTASDLKIKDDQGREYTSTSDTSSWVPEDKQMFILSNLNPNVSQQFMSFYQVPTDGKGFIVTVGDGEMFSNKTAEINLGI